MGLDGIILAGGKSRRLGTDKTIVRLGNSRLVDIALETISSVVDSIIIVTNSPQLFEGLPARVVTDVQPGTGPLGGILTGLLLGEHEHALVVACDMPFLNVGLLQHMARQVDGYDVVMPRVDDTLEPLHAIYSHHCVEPIRRLLAEGDLRIVDIINVLNEVRVRYIDKDEIDMFDPSRLSFFNINTSDDLERARAEYDRRCGRR